MRRKRQVAGFAAAALSVLLGGCLSPRSGPEARFYQLQPDLPGPQGAWPEGHPAILVGPVEIAPYLDRPQMAKRIGPTEIQYDELNRWAEPLAKNIGWVLTQNLSSLLDDRPVRLFGMPHASGEHAMVAIRVSRLDGRPNGTATLQAEWSILSPQSDLPTRGGSSRLDIDVPGSEIADVVAAQSTLLADLSRQIADSLQDDPDD